MKNDVFVDKCRHIASSIEVNHEKNLEAIKSKLLTEKENVDMFRNKKVRRPAVAAAVLVAVLSISAVVYAAVPIIWRNVDVAVTDGEQYVQSILAKISEDGTHGVVGGYFTENPGRVVIDAEGTRTVFNDGVQPHDLEEALAILQLSNVVLPAYLPYGFTVTAFAYPTADFDPYNILAMNHISIMYSNKYDDVITLMVASHEENFVLSASEENAFTRIEIYSFYAFLGENQLVLFDADSGVVYRFSSSPGVANSALVRMAESMK